MSFISAAGPAMKWQLDQGWRDAVQLGWEQLFFKEDHHDWTYISSCAEHFLSPWQSELVSPSSTSPRPIFMNHPAYQSVRSFWFHQSSPQSMLQRPTQHNKMYSPSHLLRVVLLMVTGLILVYMHTQFVYHRYFESLSWNGNYMPKAVLMCCASLNLTSSCRET